jgi:hypothetical protein
MEGLGGGGRGKTIPLGGGGEVWDSGDRAHYIYIYIYITYTYAYFYCLYIYIYIIWSQDPEIGEHVEPCDWR